MKRSVFKWLCVVVLSVLPVPMAVVWAGSSQTVIQFSHAAPLKAVSPIHQTLLIQGHVVEVKGDHITLRTPDIRPTCSAGTACPQYIVAGTTFNVDARHAKYESANGQVTTPLVRIGDNVAVYGVTSTAGTGSSLPISAHSLDASIIERIVTAPATTASVVSK